MTELSGSRLRGTRLRGTRRCAAAAVVAVLAVLAPAACGALHPQPSGPTVSAVVRPSVTPVSSAVASPATTVSAVNPCARNRTGKVVRVSLARQHLWMCDGTRLARDTAITSGMRGRYTETPRGHFRVEGRNRHSTLTLADGRSFDVAYWIPFDAPLFGFHDSPWQHFPYGSPRYATDGSHGCVHMPRTAIAYLYRWAAVGTRVTIA